MIQLWIPFLLPEFLSLSRARPSPLVTPSDFSSWKWKVSFSYHIDWWAIYWGKIINSQYIGPYRKIYWYQKFYCCRFIGDSLCICWWILGLFRVILGILELTGMSIIIETLGKIIDNRKNYLPTITLHYTHLSFTLQRDYCE